MDGRMREEEEEARWSEEERKEERIWVHLSFSITFVSSAIVSVRRVGRVERVVLTTCLNKESVGIEKAMVETTSPSPKKQALLNIETTLLTL